VAIRLRVLRARPQTTAPPAQVTEGEQVSWSARPGSRAGFAREALAERSSAASRRPSAWECDGGRETALVFASGVE
jgi:hypothetical protein